MTFPVQKPRVLVVDDDGGLLESLQLLLSDDCEVSCCASGPDALKLLAKQQMDVVITDLRMPLMSGLEFAAEVKRCCQPVPYCLMLTGTPSEVTSKSPGATDLVMVLSKPFEPARLVKMVSQLGRLALNRRGALAGEA